MKRQIFVRYVIFISIHVQSNGGVQVKTVALLSNVTVDLLGSMLSKEMDIYSPSGFDTWQQVIYSPSSELYQKKYDAMIILLCAQAHQDAWQDRTSGDQLIQEWLSAISALLEQVKNVPIFVSELDILGEMCTYGAEKKISEIFEVEFRRAVEEMHDAGASIYLLPMKKLIEEYGRKTIYSPKMWYMGSMPYSMKGIQYVAELIRQYVGVVNGRKKKCIALDLDNTLWGGVIGEDGVNGICLSEHKEGARYKDAQKLLKRMRMQGVMLSILSKNNAEDVETVFEHPDMVLQKEDFVATEINWESKTENIRKLAEQLNIGLDAFVFLDDNPAEREQMRVQHPEVEVVDFPKDTSNLPDLINEINKKYFFTLEMTDEDLKKTAMYRSEAKRKVEFQRSSSLDDYLSNLNMRISIHWMTEEEENRVVQLVNKTNQFNLTTKRYSSDEIHALCGAADSDILTVHMSDKYGDQGLVAVLILKYAGKVVTIDTFLLSCRVMGRKAETVVIASLRHLLAECNVTTVQTRYVKTSKNKPVEMFYEEAGFALEKTSGMEDEIGYTKEYALDLDSLPDFPDCFEKIEIQGTCV